MNHRRLPIDHSSSSGFTMLELLVALVILVMAFTVIWTTLTATLRGWERGTELLDQLHTGDFAMEQLVLALRSTAFFPSAPGVYGFWLDGGGSGANPRDEISWVTSGTALLPPDSELANGLYRLVVSVEDTKGGESALTVRAFPHMGDRDEYKVDPWYISGEIKGIQCRTYNLEDEIWEGQWEDTNAIPSLIELTLFMQPHEKYGEPITLTRLIEIPVAPAVTAAVVAAVGRREEGQVDEEAGTEAQQPEAQPEATPQEGGTE